MFKIQLSDIFMTADIFSGKPAGGVYAN